MAERENYKGSIELISGLKPKNDGDFPLVHAHDVQVDEDGTRLDEKLKNMGDASLTVDAVKTDGGVNIIITDKNGTKTVFIPNGTIDDGGDDDDDDDDTITHTISVFASNVLTNGATEIVDGGEYRATFTPYTEEYSSGNVRDNCRVFMGGEEITSSVMWEGNTLTIASVTDDVEITFEEIVGEYYENESGDPSVKFVLANVYATDTSGSVITNGSQYVMNGDPFWCDLHAIENENAQIYCKVMMGGEDITSQCLSGENLHNYKQIRIDMVGGDVVITATA